jgi:hypothetical protein
MNSLSWKRDKHMLLGKTRGGSNKVGDLFSHGFVVREIVVRFLAREARDFSLLEVSRQALMCW